MSTRSFFFLFFFSLFDCYCLHAKIKQASKRRDCEQQLAIEMTESEKAIEIILCLIFNRLSCLNVVRDKCSKLVCVDRFWRKIWWGNQLLVVNEKKESNKNSKLNYYKLDAKIEYSMKWRVSAGSQRVLIYKKIWLDYF